MVRYFRDFGSDIEEMKIMENEMGMGWWKR